VTARAFPIVYVSDVERSAGFYAGQLGFEEMFRMPPEGPAGYIGLALGDSRIGIVASSWPEERIAVRVGSLPRFELWVYVDDVDASVERLRGADVPVLMDPEDMPWGERMAYVADPDSNPVALASPPPAD
jgi:lactoylglutathione lyase